MSVVRQLLDAGLLDELHLFVHPATAGSGLRLFEEGGPARHLKLISSQPFATGVVYLVYAPDPNPPTGSYEEARESLPAGVSSAHGPSRGMRRPTFAASGASTRVQISAQPALDEDGNEFANSHIVELLELGLDRRRDLAFFLRLLELFDESCRDESNIARSVDRSWTSIPGLPSERVPLPARFVLYVP